MLFFLGSLTLSSCEKDHKHKTYKTKSVFVIVVDGMRYSENWGEPNQQYTTHLKNDMASEGVVFTNFRNNGPTYTSAGHTALLTGHYQSINNGGGAKPKYPNFLNYWIKVKDTISTKAWLFASKDKIEPLADCMDPAWEGKYLPSVDCGNNGLGTGYRADSITVQHILDTVEKYKPSVVFINLRQPDFNGHSGNWEKYIQGIEQVDKDYYKLWKFINENQFYRGRTSVFVTNDHGRHLDDKGGFAGHGDKCDGCRHIFLYASGPDFLKNRIVNNPYEQIDLPATIAKILNFDMPTSNGQVIREIFKY